jgi:hypothetical protein
VTRRERERGREAARERKARLRGVVLDLYAVRLSAWREQPVPFFRADLTDADIAFLAGVSPRTLARWHKEPWLRDAVAAERAATAAVYSQRQHLFEERRRAALGSVETIFDRWRRRRSR